MDAELEFIQVPNTLKNKVSYGPDGISQKTLDEAASVVADMQGDYREWVQNDLDKIENLFASIRALPVDHRGEAVRKIFGIAHDIRGFGGSFGFPLMTEIGGRLCRFIESIRHCDDIGLNVLRVHIDAMRLVLTRNMQGGGGQVGLALVAGLDALTKRFAS